MQVRNGQVSHWMAASEAAPHATTLPEHGDLVIVGAGLTGLWTAYYALRQDPGRSVVVLEAERVGYGASGRSGGWLSTLLPGNRAVYARRTGREAVVDFQRAMVDTIEECLEVMAREGIEAGQVRGGQLLLARTPAQLARVRDVRDGHRRFGLTADEVRMLDAHEAAGHVAVDGVLGGLHVPATVRVDPAALTRGLAEVVRRLGGQICEGARVTSVGRGLVGTSRGPVRARDIVLGLEAYSHALLGGREVVPVNSSVVVTEPLPASTWARIGWQGRECLSDAAHTFVYCQRTDDDRIALGGRGAPYAYGSGLPGSGEVDDRTVAALERRLQTFFPGLELPLAHAWRGVIGVSRDWCASVRWDDATRIGRVQGYAGHGITATNLAGRTLLDRLEGRRTPLTSLPWNDHRSGRWEPEPIRWAGVHGMYRLFGLADAWEESRGSARTSLLARAGSRLAGLHE